MLDRSEDPGQEEKKMAEIPEEALPLLEGRHLAHVATVMADGSPQVTPIWIDHEGNTIVFNTATGRIKPRNLERDPRVSLSVIDAENPYAPLTVRGRVVEMTTEGADEHIDALSSRYIDEDPYPFRQPGEERLIVRIEPEKVSYGLPG
jgi:PPOX class probable F420-dependent enzyme